MEGTRFGKVKIFAFGSARSAATYLVEFLIVAAIYTGLAEPARLLPAINPAATPLWPPTGFALALVLLGGYRIWPAILVGSVLLSLRLPGHGCLVAGPTVTRRLVPPLVSQSLQSFPLRRPR